MERPWRPLFLFTFACEMLHQIGQKHSTSRAVPDGAFLSPSLDLTVELWLSSSGMCFFLPTYIPTAVPEHIGISLLCCVNLHSTPTNSTPAHSCNSSCVILGGYYTSYLFSFTAAAELCWLAFLGYVLHHQ